MRLVALHGQSRNPAPSSPESLSAARLPTGYSFEVAHGPALSQPSGLSVRWRPAHRLLPLHHHRSLSFVVAARCGALAFKLRSTEPVIEALSLGCIAGAYFGAGCPSFGGQRTNRCHSTATSRVRSPASGVAPPSISASTSSGAHTSAATGSRPNQSFNLTPSGRLRQPPVAG